MRSTEIFVEQLLIGAVVALTLALSFGERHLWADLVATGDKSAVAAWITGGLGLGAAYLLGVLMDRCADSLIDPVEKHHRLRFGLSCASDHPSKWEKHFDPFDKPRLEVKVRKHGGDLGEWLHYLRSRIRLARGLAVFVPALTVAMVLALRQHPLTWWIWVFPAGYVVAGVSNMIDKKVPSTGKRKDAARYVDVRKVSEEGLSSGSLVLDVLCCSVVRLGLLLLLAAFVLAWGSARLAGVALAGTAATALAFWTWWRITDTLMKFLRRTEEVED